MSEFTLYEKFHIYNYVYSSSDIDNKLKLIQDSKPIGSTYKFVFNGVYNKSQNPIFALFNGEHEIIVPMNCKITKVIIKILDKINSSSYTMIFVMSGNSIGRGSTNKQIQDYNMNVVLIQNDVFHVRILDSKAQVPNIDKCLVTVLLETF